MKTPGASEQDSEQRDIREWNQGEGNNPEKRKGKGKGKGQQFKSKRPEKGQKTSADQEKKERPDEKQRSVEQFGMKRQRVDWAG